MSGPIKIQTIIDACNQGVHNAFHSHYKMSGGLSLWNAPEYFITSMIALELNSLEGNKYITLEHNIIDALENAGAKGRGNYIQV